MFDVVVTRLPMDGIHVLACKYVSLACFASAVTDGLPALALLADMEQWFNGARVSSTEM